MRYGQEVVGQDKRSEDLEDRHISLFALLSRSFCQIFIHVSFSLSFYRSTVACYLQKFTSG